MCCTCCSECRQKQKLMVKPKMERIYCLAAKPNFSCEWSVKYQLLKYPKYHHVVTWSVSFLLPEVHQEWKLVCWGKQWVLWLFFIWEDRMNWLILILSIWVNEFSSMLLYTKLTWFQSFFLHALCSHEVLPLIIDNTVCLFSWFGKPITFFFWKFWSSSFSTFIAVISLCSLENNFSYCLCLLSCMWGVYM